jgi:hypothetical protein
MGAGEEDKEERERKAHKRVDDATPVSGPFLKAVVASQDLGAAGTEFERSLISFPCNKNYHFLYDFYGPLPLLFQCRFISLSCHLIPPIFYFFIRMPREAAWADFCFVRCFSRSAFLVACVTRSNEIYPIGDQPISPPRYSQIFLPTPAGSPGNVAPPSPPIWPLHRAFTHFDERIRPLDFISPTFPTSLARCPPRQHEILQYLSSVPVS